MEYILYILIGYLIGSIPFSYLIVKYRHNLNVIETGSNNAGALNSYEISNNKLTAIFVLLLDILKGVSIVLLYLFIFSKNIDFLKLASIWVIIGHIASVFIRFKGGRGLATAAGLFLLINPYLLVTWLVMWLIGYFAVQKNVHIANTFALISSMILCFSTPDELIKIFDFLHINDIYSVKFIFIIIGFIIIFKHIKPLKDLFQKN